MCAACRLTGGPSRQTNRSAEHEEDESVQLTVAVAASILSFLWRFEL